MDGVLVDSYAAHLQSWRLLAAELGRNLTEDQFAATFGQRSAEIIRQLFGVNDVAAVRRLDDRKESLYRDLIRRQCPAMSGARELVVACHEAGIRMAVGSSGPKANVTLVCAELRIEPLLAAIVCGEDVHHGKPDPEVFLIAAERINLPPSRCVVIEDAPVGLEAAHRAGMRCIGLVGSHSANSLKAAHRIVNSLRELGARDIEILVTP